MYISDSEQHSDQFYHESVAAWEVAPALFTSVAMLVVNFFLFTVENARSEESRWYHINRTMRKDILFIGKRGLEVTGILAFGLGLRNLDVYALNFARQLENLVLNLSDLERIGYKTSREHMSI